MYPILWIAMNMVDYSPKNSAITLLQSINHYSSDMGNVSKNDPATNNVVADPDNDPDDMMVQW